VTTPSRSAWNGRGAWRDNVFVKRVWRSVKNEEFYLKAYASVGEARASIGRYLDFYNRKRPHSRHGGHPLALHASSDPSQQASIMNPVKELGQVEIYDRLITSLQISCCFSNGGVSAVVPPESVTAGMKGRLEDRLHYLADRLLHHPVDHVRNAEPPLSTAWLRQPDATNIAGVVASRQ